MTENQDLRERCFYLLTLFKARNKALFEKYTTQLAKITAEESANFYHYLLSEYKKLVEGPGFQPAEEKVGMPETPKASPPRKVSTPKKNPKKKVAKKAKKKVAKKLVKKVAKKTSKKAKKTKKIKKR